eukprot:12796114-Alexandrium_andersonii.AAC.1
MPCFQPQAEGLVRQSGQGHVACTMLTRSCSARFRLLYPSAPEPDRRNSLCSLMIRRPMTVVVSCL